MLWNKILLVLLIEIVVSFAMGRVLIPYFRKLKTGKLELYVGDRFQKDEQNTPKFGGIIILLVLIIAIALGLGVVLQSSQLGDFNYSSRVLTGVIFSGLLMIVGTFEDFTKDCKSKAVGFKLRHKVFIEFLLSLALLISLYLQGDNTQEVLLPFGLGYLSFGVLYYPLMAVFMTCTINMVKLHDCFGGDTSSGIDGLCCATTVVFSLFVAICSDIADNSFAQVYAYCIAGAAAGMLIWGLSPAKIYIGESGSLLLGGLVSSLVIVSQMHVVFLLAGLAFVVDSICALVQYFVYRKNKKLVFQGNSLHAHLKAKNWSDYKIIALFGLITVVGGAVSIGFAMYKTKF